MAHALTSYAGARRTSRPLRPNGDPVDLDSTDSIRAIVGWTLISVLGFWTPLAVVAFMLVA